MASVRSEINKTLSSLTSRSFCSPKQQICVQGPPGMQGPKGTRGRRGPRGATGRKGSRGDTGEPGRSAWKAGNYGTTGSKGRTRNPRSAGSQGYPRCKGRTRGIHFTSYGSDIPDESNSYRKSKRRVPVLNQWKSATDPHLATREQRSVKESFSL